MQVYWNIKPTAHDTPTHLHSHLLLLNAPAMTAKAKESASQRTVTVQIVLQTITDTARNVNRFGQSVCGLETVVLRMNSSGDAYNIRLKEILKRRALFGNQTVVLLTGSGALTNSGASNPFFLKLL